MFLGLNSTTLSAISKLILTSDVTDDVIAVIRHVVEQLNNRLLSENEQSVEMPVNVKLWHTPGCHELLASLGKYCYAWLFYFYDYNLSNLFVQVSI